MSDRPLVDATADLRLSDSKITRDLAAIRRRLLTDIAALEKQATIEVDVKPNVSQLRRNITAELARLQGGAAITIPVDANTTQANQQILATKTAAEAAGINIPVTADTAGYRNEISALKAQLAFDDVNLQIEVRRDQINDAEDALIRLATLANTIESNRIVIDADLRDAAIQAELARIQGILTALDAQEIDIDVDVDAATALSQLSTITAAVGALDGRDIDIRFDSEGLARLGTEIAVVDAAADRAANQNTGGVGRFAARLGFLAVGGVAAIGAAGAAITVLGVQSAAALEGTIKSFENILGSAEAADSLFKQLQAFAIPSPFDTQVLANTARQLLAIGITVDEVVPTVKDLGAIVALLGNSSSEAFGRLTLALGQIRTSVKPLTQDLRQITSTLPGFNTELQLAEGVAEQFGVSFAEAQDLIKDGSITGEGAVDILLKRMQEFPGVAGSIEAAAQTLQGKLSAFGDTVKVNLIDAFAGVSTIVADSLDPLSESVDIALKAIGPALAASFTDLVPTVLGFVEPLGLALAPAFAGIFESVGLALEGIVPAITEILPLIGEIAPVLGEIIGSVGPAVADTAGVLGDLLVPALQALAGVLNVIPTPVLSTLVTAFVAFKAASGVASILANITAAFQNFGRTAPQIQAAALAAQGAGQQIEQTGTRFERAQQYLAGGSDRLKTAQGAITAASIGAVAAIGAIGLASEDTATQVTSLVSSVGAVAAGFATGGPIGGAIAAAGVGIGALVGAFQSASREAKALEERTDTLAESLLEATLAISENVDELDALIAKQGEAATAAQLLGESVFEAGEKGEKAQVALSEIGIVSTGTEGAENIVRVLTQIGAFGDPDGNVANVPEIIGALTDSFGSQAPAIADIISRYDDLDDIEIALFNDLGISFDDLTLKQQDLIKAIEELQDRSEDTDFSGQIRQTLELGAATEEQFRKALLAAEAITGFDRKTEDSIELAELYRVTLANLGNEFGNLANEALGIRSRDEIDLDNIFVLSPERIKELGKDAEDAIADAGGDTNDALQKQLEEALDIVSKATDDLQSEFSKLNSVLSLDVARQNLAEDTAALSDALTGLVGGEEFERAQEEAERLVESIADQRSRIADLRVDVAREQADAQTEAADLEARIAEAKAAGAVLGVAALERQREFVNADADAKQRQLDDAVRKLAETQAKLDSLDLSQPGNIIDTVKAQAEAAGLELYPFLLAAPTDEAKQVYQDIIGGIFSDTLSTAAQIDDPDELIKFVADSTQIIRQELIDGGVDPETANALINRLLDPATLVTTASNLAKETRDAFAIQMSIEEPAVIPVTADTSAAETQAQTFRDLIGATPVEIPFFIANPNTDRPVAPQPRRGDANGIFDGVFGRSVAEADGGLLEFFRNGGFSGMARDAAHVAQIVPAATWRVMAEPETGGEGYIPLSPMKRRRSTQVLTTIADMFGLEVRPKDEPALPPRVVSVGGGFSEDAMARAVEKGMSASRKASPGARARAHDAAVRSVTVEKIEVSGVRNPSTAANKMIRRLSDVAMGHVDWDDWED